MMNFSEQELLYPLSDGPPEPGGTLEVAPGVRWIRMDLPFALDHINLWLLRDRIDSVEGWTVVDCGVHLEAAKAQWEKLFELELQGLPILRVIVTHMHPDHIGLAQWLCESWSAPLWISATDYYAARVGSLGGFGASTRFFASHGLTEPQVLDRSKRHSDFFATLVPSVPRCFRRMTDGEVIRIGGHDWHAISGGGHAPEHMALHCPELGVLLGGDMILPRISPNISVYETEPEANPLKLYLLSIEKFASLPSATLVLPAHGTPFVGLHTRISQLREHHEERLRELLEACAIQPRSAFEVLPLMFKRELDRHQTLFALGEAVAHLHVLWYAGQVDRTLGSDSVYRFFATTKSESNA